jgi:hypothetical protein
MKDASKNGALYSPSRASEPLQKSNSKPSTFHRITPLLLWPHSDTIFSALQMMTRSLPISGDVQDSPNLRKEWPPAKCLPFVIHSPPSYFQQTPLFHSPVLTSFSGRPRPNINPTLPRTLNIPHSWRLSNTLPTLPRTRKLVAAANPFYDDGVPHSLCMSFAPT